MNYFVLIIVAIAGVALGMYLARRKENARRIEKPRTSSDFSRFIREASSGEKKKVFMEVA